MLSLGNRFNPGVHQGHLESVLHTLFPNDNILSNVRKGGSIRSPATGTFVELDLWLPKWQISFEFQDAYHYVNTWDSQLPLDVVQLRDMLKWTSVRTTTTTTTTLVVVPCWWDGLADSLLASISFNRPDIFDHHQQQQQQLSSPIPLNAPPNYFTRENIPDVGSLMLASFPSDTEVYSDISRLNSWWLGEKYDGIRFCWNPNHQSLHSRSGMQLSLESAFLDHFPALFLDGEIWFGRGNFGDVQRVVMAAMTRSTTTTTITSTTTATIPTASSDSEDSTEWCHLRMLAFDVPPGGQTTFPLHMMFEERYWSLLSLIADDHPFISNALRFLCTSKAQLISSTNSVVRDGGEGVILRKPYSLYEKGRSTNLFKFKATRGDKEALVLLVYASPDQSCVLQLTDGRTIQVPCPKGISPKKGDIVTYSYDSFSRNGLPVNPVILRVRQDSEWLASSGSSSDEGFGQNTDVETQPLNTVSLKAMGRDVRGSHLRPTMDTDKIKRRRLFFERFARDRNFDPLVAENWYQISRKAVEKTKGGNTVLGHYKGSLVKALLNLFPTIGLDKYKFSALPKKHWLSVENRRNFFIDFANHKKFDPLVASNWRGVSKEVILQRKGGYSLLELHNGDLKTALSSLFPEVKFGEDDFKELKSSIGEPDTTNFFHNFANEKQFDPLIPANWYIWAGSVLASKDARAILHHYNFDVVRAVLRVFPLIGLDEVTLYTSYNNYWYQQLHDFAMRKTFDPLIPDNWYHFTREREIVFHSKSDETPQLRVHRELVIKELFKHFPFIGLEKSKFAFLSDNYSADDRGRNRFFERVANIMKFDPNIAENWYSVTRQDIMQVKGGSAVLRHYGFSYVKAITALKPALALKSDKFVTLSRNHWKSASNRRSFMNRYAEQNGFDPLQGQGWGRVLVKHFAEQKGGASILRHHRFSLAQAVHDLYPDIVYPDIEVDVDIKHSTAREGMTERARARARMTRGKAKMMQ